MIENFLFNINDPRHSTMDRDTYDFVDYRSDVQSIVHSINLLGEDLVGAEIGIFKGQSFCTLLQNCLNIKTLHGIDSWVPYVDYLKNPYDGTPAITVGISEIELVEFTARHNIKFSGHSQKAVIHKMDSKEASNLFTDQYFDFVFIDTYLTYEQCVGDLEDWYCKVKKGGLFSGHDWNCSEIRKALFQFRSKHKIQSRLSIFDNTWCWIK